jgi:hypothetical protein
MSQDHILAHKHSIMHRNELENSSLCGCFYCLAIFPPSDIVEWIDDGQTALCPKCPVDSVIGSMSGPVDSVIGSMSGYPITTEFLQRMHDHWF